MKTPRVASPRVRDAARLLPIIGLFLFMPPVVTLFAADADVGGVPLIVAYIFGVWLALIVCAAWLGRRLAPAPDSGEGASDGGNAPRGSEKAGDRNR